MALSAFVLKGLLECDVTKVRARNDHELEQYSNFYAKVRSPLANRKREESHVTVCSRTLHILL